MSLLRRLAERLRRGKDRAEESHGPSQASAGQGPSDTVETFNTEPTDQGTSYVTRPTESLVVTPDNVQVTGVAPAMHVPPQRTVEVVPGRALRRDALGRIHLKIVFYGPSLSGKTTALRWLFANVRSLGKGRIVEISDDLGRTTFFDFVPVTASSKVVFDVFTVAGQRRHASNRIAVLRGVDGIIFMADSAPEQMAENMASIEELRIALGTDRMAMMPLVVALNKRDLPNALPVDYMIDMLDLQGHPVFETIATQGTNLLRMFQRILRDSLIFKVGL